MRVLALPLLAVSLLAPGCATIIHGSNQDVAFSSSPSGATVTVDGEALGTTPLVTGLSRDDAHTVRITMDGYQPYEMTLTKSVDGWVWGNIVFGGLIGLGVDAATGAMYKLSPDQVSADLRSLSAGTSASGALQVAVVLEVDPSWERVGQLQPAP